MTQTSLQFAGIVYSGNFKLDIESLSGLLKQISFLCKMKLFMNITEHVIVIPLKKRGEIREGLKQNFTILNIQKNSIF